MKIAAGSDHAGLALKRQLVERLRTQGHEVHDLGTHDAQSCDYPDYAALVARAVAQGEADRGLLVCGTGQGMAMAANRVPGVRAAVCADTFTARATRAHNDANVLCIGERVVGPGLAGDIVDAFVSGPFEGGRHANRVAKIAALEQR
ncbi:MAG: ribose 5-phosphate isomerase B [Deltaproteobacteria bacterium]|nr:ribose 5-phosphate isomerase B [Deltaproteobacteria bacterium]